MSQFPDRPIEAATWERVWIATMGNGPATQHAEIAWRCHLTGEHSAARRWLWRAREAVDQNPTEVTSGHD